MSGRVFRGTMTKGCRSTLVSTETLPNVWRGRTRRTKSNTKYGSEKVATVSMIDIDSNH